MREEIGEIHRELDHALPFKLDSPEVGREEECHTFVGRESYRRIAGAGIMHNAVLAQRPVRVVHDIRLIDALDET